MNEALQYVYDKELKYMPAALVQEMEGIAEGMCVTLGGHCNVTEWTLLIKQTNMLPELIRYYAYISLYIFCSPTLKYFIHSMACTAYGAWDDASVDGKLIQVRALDFGSGPFANYTIVAVHRNIQMRAFVTVGFPGFVGVVTGIAQNGIGISEKVWMTYDRIGIQPGSINLFSLSIFKPAV